MKKQNSDMDFSFLDRTLKVTGLLLLIFFPFGIYYFGFFNSLAVLSGGVWGMLNLILITFLVTTVFKPNSPKGARAIVISLIKFPLLYLAGYFLLSVPQFQAIYLVSGFTLFLLVLVLKAFGRLLVDWNNDNASSIDGETMRSV